MTSSLDLIHHDGSDNCVTYSSNDAGSTIEVRLRVPKSLVISEIKVRTVRDGEPVYLPTVLCKDEGIYRWYSALLPIHNPKTKYRWRLSGGDVLYGWYNQEGWHGHDINDEADFIATTFDEIADWTKSAVVYQIFPDRFASSGREYSAPAWAVKRSWDQLPEGASKNTGKEYFGGDLWGVIDRLDYLEELGITVLYFTPFFPAGSTHRYDASTFDHVDPLLGGDEALIELVRQAHARDMKVIGDITLNHSGATHEWFIAAKSNDPQNSQSLYYRNFYTFDKNCEHGYESWLGVSSLPKFDYRSKELQKELITGENSVLRKWLKPPFNLDGWRVDVANMSGRLRELDMTHDVARMSRKAVLSEGLAKILIAEHNHDAGLDLSGDGWQGNMNYTAFRNPVWNWLVDDEYLSEGKHGFFPRATGAEMVAIIRSFTAVMPWKTYIASWNLLSSHDSARVRTIVGGLEKQIAGAVLLFTLPGTPMIFAGDEIGAQGKWGEDARTPHPWFNPEKWDHEILAIYKSLIRIRKEEKALACGGLRFIAIKDDYLIFVREISEEQLLVLVARAGVANLEIDLQLLGSLRVEKIFGFNSTVVGERLKVEVPSAGGGIWKLL